MPALRRASVGGTLLPECPTAAASGYVSIAVSENVYVSFTTTATTAGDATEGSASELLTPRQVRCTARFRPASCRLRVIHVGSGLSAFGGTADMNS